MSADGLLFRLDSVQWWADVQWADKMIVEGTPFSLQELISKSVDAKLEVGLEKMKAGVLAELRANLDQSPIPPSGSPSSRVSFISKCACCAFYLGFCSYAMCAVLVKFRLFSGLSGWPVPKSMRRSSTPTNLHFMQ